MSLPLCATGAHSTDFGRRLTHVRIVAELAALRGVVEHHVLRRADHVVHDALRAGHATGAAAPPSARAPGSGALLMPCTRNSPSDSSTSTTDSAPAFSMMMSMSLREQPLEDDLPRDGLARLEHRREIERVAALRRGTPSVVELGRRPRPSCCARRADPYFGAAGRRPCRVRPTPRRRAAPCPSRVSRTRACRRRTRNAPRARPPAPRCSRTPASRAASIARS